VSTEAIGASEEFMAGATEAFATFCEKALDAAGAGAVALFDNSAVTLFEIEYFWEFTGSNDCVFGKTESEGISAARAIALVGRLWFGVFVSHAEGSKSLCRGSATATEVDIFVSGETTFDKDPTVAGEIGGAIVETEASE
jgi:hypothetical protein